MHFRTRFAGRFGRIRAIARVAVYLLCLNLVFGAWLLKHARAHGEEAVHRAGAELLHTLGPKLVGPPQAVRLNGATMLLSSRTVRGTVGDVLTSVERHCENPGEAPSAATSSGEWDFSRLLSLRLEDAKTGMGQVACFANRDRDKTFDSFVARLSRFAETFDLSALGPMRYAVARPAGAELTHLLLMWGEGALDVPAMFPGTVDAPGSDSTYAPRPPDSLRVLCAEVADQPYALRLYDSTQTHTEVLALYDRTMPERGWTLTPASPHPELPSLASHLRTYVRDGAALIVLVGTTPAGKTSVSLVELGSAGHVRVESRERP